MPKVGVATRSFWLLPRRHEEHKGHEVQQPGVAPVL